MLVCKDCEAVRLSTRTLTENGVPAYLVEGNRNLARDCSMIGREQCIKWGSLSSSPTSVQVRKTAWEKKS
jgi:hypothetical protein